MSNPKISSSRMAIFVFNVLILVLSFFVTTNYAVQPFWKVNATIKLSQEKLLEFIPADDYPNADLDKVFADGLEVHTEIVIPAETLWNTTTDMLAQLVQHGNLNPDMTETTNNLLGTQVDNIVNEFLPILENVALEIAKSVAIEQAKQSIFDSLSGSGTADEIQAKLNDANLGDDYFDEKMTNLTDALKEDDKTAEQAADIVVNLIDEIIGDLQNVDDATLNSITDVDTDALREKVVEGLAKFENEDGVINIEDAIASMLLGGLDSLTPSDDSALVSATPVNAMVEPQEDSDSVKQLKEDVKAKIYELLPENINDIIGSALKISAGVLLFSLFTWAYVVIKILCKMFFHDNSVKLRLPLLLGHLPGLALWLAPTLAYQFTKGSAEMQMFALQFGSSGTFAVIAAFILFIISIPYCSMRRPLKRRKLR